MQQETPSRTFRTLPMIFRGYAERQTVKPIQAFVRVQSQPSQACIRNVVIDHRDGEARTLLARACYSAMDASQKSTTEDSRSSEEQ
ncbi:hypothetical protein V5799_026229 [Amblyomma americanum]|uniref:Uncharacterized protein n=1 Tax=Amblyomma americanum TaxID=6943 RepID=A0AAQ4DJ64_AMBAM